MTAPAPSLTVAFATMGSRVAGITADKLPPKPGVDYLITVQGGDDSALDIFTDRPDITVIPVHGIGVARNRNAAIHAARGDILLFCDDDITPFPASWDQLAQAFQQNPDLDFICGRCHDPDGNPRKTYSPAQQPARWSNTGKVGTPELAIRLAPVQAHALRFDKDFGAGTAQWSGDEYIFICDMLGRGLQGRHLDLVFGSHPHDSSGLTQSRESYAIRKRVFQRALGKRLGLLARWAFALKRFRQFPDWQSLLRFLF